MHAIQYLCAQYQASLTPEPMEMQEAHQQVLGLDVVPKEGGNLGSRHDFLASKPGSHLI